MTKAVLRTALALWVGAWLTASSEAQAQAGGSKKNGPSVKGVVKRVEKAHSEAAGAQKKVESLSDEALDLSAQYRNVQRRISSLKVYNEQLQTLIDNQQSQIDGVRKQIEEVSVVGRQVMPLMQRMVDSLARFVELDIPFLPEERKKRVQQLRELMTRADVNNAEKYRRVVEAYEIENEYGRTIEAYKGKLKDGDTEKAVEFLRIGRVSLVYRTLDGKECGAWDTQAGGWARLPQSYQRDIMTGLRIAREQAAPDLLRVPIPAPEDAAQPSAGGAQE